MGRTKSGSAGRGLLLHPSWAMGRAAKRETCSPKLATQVPRSLRRETLPTAKARSRPRMMLHRRRSPQIALALPSGHLPNAETAKVLREAREGKNLLHYESLEEMFKDLGI